MNILIIKWLKKTTKKKKPFLSLLELLCDAFLCHWSHWHGDVSLSQPSYFYTESPGFCHVLKDKQNQIKTSFLIPSITRTEPADSSDCCYYLLNENKYQLDLCL